MRAIPALTVIAVLIAAAVFVADRPGTVEVVWQGWQIETSVGVLVLGVVVFALLAAALFHFIRKLVGGPKAFLRARRERRRREGYRALTQGMVAVAAGDAEEAQKLARKADVLLAEPPLTLLLSAQAAQLKGDEQAAQRYFTAMLDRPETEFLGLRGLIMQAMRGGDEATALRLTERAKALRPKTPWVLTSLIELQARAGRWGEADATLAEATRRKALPAPESRHRRAVLLHERSRKAEAENQPRDALRLAAKAHGLDPGFAPAAAHYARLLVADGHQRHARKAIEAAWRVEPHPALAEAYDRIFAEEPPLARMKHAERLASLKPEHVESALALARAALAAKLWGEARRHLDKAGALLGADTPPSQRVCQLMAELEESQHEDHAAARGWLARAAANPTPDSAYLCHACGAETPHWAPLCPRCRGFDTLAWRPPGLPPAAPLAASASDTPALPGPAPRPAAVDAAGPRM
jgi:HemY protein